MSAENDMPIGWAILEVMGHRRIAGFISEQTVAGAAMLRIDVPGPGVEPIATQLYHPSAVFCITPVSEEAALAVARRNKPEPAHQWELPKPVEITESSRPRPYIDQADDEDEDDDFDDRDEDITDDKNFEF